jgi:hypothetical protein
VLLYDTLVDMGVKPSEVTRIVMRRTKAMSEEQLRGVQVGDRVSFFNGEHSAEVFEIGQWKDIKQRYTDLAEEALTNGSIPPHISESQLGRVWVMRGDDGHMWLLGSSQMKLFAGVQKSIDDYAGTVAQMAAQSDWPMLHDLLQDHGLLPEHARDVVDDLEAVWSQLSDGYDTDQHKIYLTELRNLLVQIDFTPEEIERFWELNIHSDYRPAPRGPRPKAAPSNELLGAMYDIGAEEYPYSDNMFVVQELPGNRFILLDPNRAAGTVNIECARNGGDYYETGAKLQPGTVDFARKLVAVLQRLGAAGQRVSYVAEPKRAAAYRRLMESLGWTLVQNQGASFTWQPPETVAKSIDGEAYRVAEKVVEGMGGPTVHQAWDSSDIVEKMTMDELRARRRIDENGEESEEGEWVETPLRSGGHEHLIDVLQASGEDEIYFGYGEVESIDPAELYTMQRTVNPDIVQQYVEDPGHTPRNPDTNQVAAIKREGRRILFNGNHRAVAALVRGEPIDVHVVDMDRAREYEEQLREKKAPVTKRHRTGKALAEHDDEARTVLWVMTTGTLDRDNETVDPAGGNFNEFELNKPVAWNHDTDDFPIGTIVGLPWVDEIGEGTAHPVAANGASLGERRTALLGEVYFSAENPKGDQAYRMAKEGTLGGGSISFLPEGRTERNSAGGTHYPKWKLLEFTICQIGSNPDAVALAKRLSIMKVRDYRVAYRDPPEPVAATEAEIESQRRRVGSEQPGGSARRPPRGTSEDPYSDGYEAFLRGDHVNPYREASGRRRVTGAYAERTELWDAGYQDAFRESERQDKGLTGHRGYHIETVMFPGYWQWAVYRGPSMSATANGYAQSRDDAEEAAREWIDAHSTERRHGERRQRHSDTHEFDAEDYIHFIPGDRIVLPKPVDRRSGRDRRSR